VLALSHTSGRVFRLLIVTFVAVSLLGATPTTPPTVADREQRVLIVELHGPVDPVLGAYLHRVLTGLNKGDYDAVILDIDTPGGRGDVMARMSKTLIECRVPTVAFVSNWALSAGAFIAMSAERIYMAPRAVMGAARGYIPGPGGLPAELPEHIEEKMASANRAQFRALAQSRGYPPALAEAMADESIEVKMVIYDGRVQYLKTDEIATLEEDPLAKDKLKIIETVSPKGRLITFTGKEAVKYRMARQIAENLEAVLAAENLSGAAQIRAEMSWADKVVAALTAPGGLMLLVLIGFGCVWVEIRIPGFGFFGTLAVIAFILVFASQFLVGNAKAIEILLFLVGVALLTIEVFVTPGFGFIGGAGILCVFVSLVLAAQPFVVPSEPWQYDLLRVNLLASVGGIAGSFVIMLIAAWLLPNTPAFRRLMLETSQRPEAGFHTGVKEGQGLVGKTGVLLTALRPAGKLEIDDQTYSVVSESEFVDAGHRARVIRVDGPRIVVEVLPEPSEMPPKAEA
jgi:membrane-bound serine protease (ClpP class)